MGAWCLCVWGNVCVSPALKTKILLTTQQPRAAKNSLSRTAHTRNFESRNILCAENLQSAIFHALSRRFWGFKCPTCHPLHRVKVLNKRQGRENQTLPTQGQSLSGCAGCRSWRVADSVRTAGSKAHGVGGGCNPRSLDPRQYTHFKPAPPLLGPAQKAWS